MNSRVARVLKAIEALRIGDIPELVSAIHETQQAVATAIVDGAKAGAASADVREGGGAS